MVFFKIMESIFLKNPTIFSQIILLFSNFFFINTFFTIFYHGKPFLKKTKKKKTLFKSSTKKMCKLWFFKQSFSKNPLVSY